MSSVWVLLVPLVDEAPAPEDVKAGWGAFAVFLLLAAAVVVLGISLNRHLKRTRSNFTARDSAERAAADRADGDNTGRM